MNESDNNTMSILDALIIDIIDDLPLVPLEAKVSVTNYDMDEIRVLELVLGKYLRYKLDQLNETGNEELITECIERSEDESLGDVVAAVFILKEIWKQLRETHRLKVVKDPKGG